MARQASSSVRSQTPSEPDLRIVREKTNAIERLDIDPANEAVAGPDGTPDGTPDLTEDEIRTAAYTRYVERGSEDGHDEEDWLAAEQELRASRGARR